MSHPASTPSGGHAPSRPFSLDSLLAADASAPVIEAPRSERLIALATALGSSAEAALASLAAAAGIPALADPAIDLESIRILPARLVHEYQLIPVSIKSVAPSAAPSEVLYETVATTENAPPAPLYLATAWPPTAEIADWIATFTPRPLVWYLASAERVRELIVANYGVGGGSLEDELDSNLPALVSSEAEADEDAAVVRFVTDVISQGITEAATDVHFEPQEEQLRIRYRIDGLLVHVPVPDNLRRFQDAILSRLKIMARLNISEKRLPQDGRINFKAGTTALDIRVSTFPTLYGESISLRLLNQKKEAYNMDRLGMSQAEQAVIGKVLDYPHGIILVTGPTGSGKSTSLNAFLRKINSPDLRIVTIEDPVEYEVPGANQMQTRAEIGLTFASALRSVLRQDPDVIMVGEVRDLETAEIAIRASLTGHLVFSTLHTNDAPGAITRLIDMGVEPFLVASAVELVIAQRLVRRLCPACTKPAPIDHDRVQADLVALGLPPTLADGVTQLNAPVGCRACRNTGYRGRIGIFEILHPKPLHDLIVKRESGRALTEQAIANGMTTLSESGWERVRNGQTTFDELLRALATTD
ncbi:secretion system protein E [Verrucomicrobia bacterium IMCC26134]|nr:secretion system protein E [Verrucomicrobia bacterium IMCC26134]